MSALAPVVLDASALLAFLHREPGHDTVRAVLRGAVISSVNWSEVVQKASVRGLLVSGLRPDLLALGMDILPFAAEDAEQAALLWPHTRLLGLSLGDRACLALGQRLRIPVFTADRTWRTLTLGLDVRVIR